MRTSISCAALHDSVAPSIGAILRNDIAIGQVGVAVDHLVRAINESDDSNPYFNPGVALAQVQILNWASRIERNISEIDQRLTDERFPGASQDANLGPIRDSLRRIASQQEQLLNVLYSIAYSTHPEICAPIWIPCRTRCGGSTGTQRTCPEASLVRSTKSPSKMLGSRMRSRTRRRRELPRWL